MDLKPVIVTALYDIGRDKWKNYTASYGGYLDWMERVLAIDCDMVVFTDKFEKEIKERRAKYNLDSDLVIIVKPLEELYAYQRYYDKLNELMNSGTFKAKIQFEVPEMTKPLYNVIMFNKIFFMTEVFEMNYIESDILLWVDAGCFREEIKTDKWPNPSKLNSEKPMFFSHSKDFNILDWEYQAMSQIRNIQGGCFTCPSNEISELADSFERVVDYCLREGFIGSDEKILDIMYVLDKEKYSITKCGWREYYNILK